MGKIFSWLLLSLFFTLSFTAEARWQVKSEFQLLLTEPLFDKLIQDFWQSLQGTQIIPVGNVSLNAGNNTSVQINGINVNVNYSFPLPQRADPTIREWSLKSDTLGARVTADQLLVTQVQNVVQNGIHFQIKVTAECRNIAVKLPPGSASISALIRADVAQNLIQLTMPTYSAQWPSDAWQVESLNCPQLANIQGLVQAQIVQYLSSFENLDHDVNTALTAQFVKWSNAASLLLLSQQELPTSNDYLKVHYEPQTVRENNGQGLVLGGTLRFEYPYLAQGQEFLQEYDLPATAQLVPQATPQLIVPFAAIRSLMMGEYFAGKLEYTTRSPEIPAFQDLMQSRFKQFFGWPDLMNFAKDTTFLFQFQPLGPPAFENETAGRGGAINGNLTLPLSARMYAPLQGIYTPYVEFRTLLSGPTSMTLQDHGKVNFKIAATAQPSTYTFAQNYLASRHPNTHIAIDTIANATRSSLNADGMQLTIPSFAVGKQLKLVPSTWSLQSEKVLKLDFDAQ